MFLIHRFLILLLVSAVASSLPLPISAQAMERINAIVAVVNKTPITELEVAQEARRIRYGNNIDLKAARRQALDSLINRHLQLQRIERYNIREVPDKIVAERIEQLRREIGAANEEEMMAYVKNRFFMSYPKFIQRVKEDIRIQSLYYQELYSRTQVYEEEIDQYLRTETDAGERRQYRLGHILIAKNTDADKRRELAQELRDRVAAGENFALLATTYSDGERAAEGGDFDFQYEEDLPQVFLETVLGLEVGEISDVVETSRGFHLLKLTDKRGGELRGKVERIRLSHIFLSANAETTAQALYKQLNNGGLSFKDAVRDYSTDKYSKGKDGDLGWFADNDLLPYFAKATKNLTVGEVSPPTQSPYGWHLVLLTERRTDALDMDLMRDRAQRVLRERRALAQREIWLQQLRGEAYINIYSPEFVSLAAQ